MAVYTHTHYMMGITYSMSRYNQLINVPADVIQEMRKMGRTWATAFPNGLKRAMMTVAISLSPDGNQSPATLVGVFVKRGWEQPHIA